MDEKLLHQCRPACGRHEHTDGDIYYPLHTFDHSNHDIYKWLYLNLAPIHYNSALHHVYANDHYQADAGDGDFNIDFHQTTNHQSFLEDSYYHDHHYQL